MDHLAPFTASTRFTSLPSAISNLCQSFPSAPGPISVPAARVHTPALPGVVHVRMRVLQRARLLSKVKLAARLVLRALVRYRIVRGGALAAAEDGDARTCCVW